ncbi:DinF protein [Spironucleus salmonicida]|uniref:DinF protein n=1 Tax=Spironucleus salmonicida TaxID=348837 RepID=V6LSJ5_9EUKA|nr:DinF protein [Spironucleus salmonicida]|eukprot:EST43744.1 DinF protein [Spironucleus salmonicida]
MSEDNKDDENFAPEPSPTDNLHEYYVKTDPSKMILGAFIPSILQNILATFSYLLSYSIQTLYFGDQTIYSYASFMPIWFIFAILVPCSAAEVTALQYAKLIGRRAAVDEFQQFFARSIWVMALSGVLGSAMSLGMSVVLFGRLHASPTYRLFYYVWSALYPLLVAFSFGPNFWFRTENRKFLIFCRFSYQFVTQLLIEYALYYLFAPSSPWPTLVALIASFSLTTAWQVFLIKEKTIFSILVRYVVRFDLGLCKALFVPQTWLVEAKAIFLPFIDIFFRVAAQSGEAAAVLICLHFASQYEDKFYQFATYLDLTLYYMFGALFKIVGNTLYQVILTPIHVNFSILQYNRTLEIVKKALTWYVILTAVIALVFYFIFSQLASFLTFNQDDQTHNLTFLYFRDYRAHLGIIAIVTTVSNSLEGLIMTALAFSGLDSNRFYPLSLLLVRVGIAVYGGAQLMTEVGEFAQFGYVLLFANCGAAICGVLWLAFYVVKFKLVWKEKRQRKKVSLDEEMAKMKEEEE